MDSKKGELDFNKQILKELTELEKLISNDCAVDNGVFDTLSDEESNWIKRIHEMQELCDSQISTSEPLTKALRLKSVSGSALIKVENAYIEDADTVDSYDVTGRVRELWITESEFDSVKCINN